MKYRVTDTATSDSDIEEHDKMMSIKKSDKRIRYYSKKRRSFRAIQNANISIHKQKRIEELI